MNATQTKQLLARKIRGFQRVGKHLREILNREPTGEEVSAVRVEIHRQTAIAAARQAARGDALGNWPDKLAHRARFLQNHYAEQAAFARAERDRLAAEERIRAGARDLPVFVAAGLEHLFGRHKIEKSKRGTYAHTDRRWYYAMTAHECELLGLVPGPGNF